MATSTAMAAAAAHSIPGFSIPAMPRIRPPPIPKGTPGPNTRPMPLSKNKALVWADGDWRNPESNAAIHRSKIVTRQMQKALQAKVHGMNIYAYKNLHSNQVIYSLSNHMDEKKILKQFVFLGKKSVPASIRPDMWRPYFSVHFPKTPAGAAQGLQVYQEMRELSLKHQLEAPKPVTHKLDSATFAVKADGENDAKYQLGDKDKTYIKYERRPVYTRKFNREERMERIMNQASSSVAILSSVLARQAKLEETPVQILTKQADDRKRRELALSARASARLARLRVQEAEKAAQKSALAESITITPDQIRLAGRDIASLKQLWKEQELANTATQQQVGASAAYVHAQALSDAAKQSLVFRVIAETTAQVDSELDSLSADAKARALKDIELEKASVASDLDAQLAETIQKFKAMHGALRVSFGTDRLSASQQALIHTLRNSHLEQIKAMRRDFARRKEFVGPYSVVLEEIARVVEQHEAEWEETSKPLREAAEQELAAEEDASYEIKVQWADLSDGLRAKDWPEVVSHYQLANSDMNHFSTDARTEQPKLRQDYVQDQFENEWERVQPVFSRVATKIQAAEQSELMNLQDKNFNKARDLVAQSLAELLSKSSPGQATEASQYAQISQALDEMSDLAANSPRWTKEQKTWLQNYRELLQLHLKHLAVFHTTSAAREALEDLVERPESIVRTRSAANTGSYEA